MPEAPHGGRINMPPPMDMPPTRESITAFVRNNIVDAKYNRLVCGDGRYRPDQSMGALHMFGGDMGALAAFWRAGKKADPPHFNSITDIERCVVEYQDAKVKALSDFGVPETEARRLYLHTDGHGDEANGKYGCGHMTHLSGGVLADKDYYDTDDAEMRALFQYVTTSGKVDHEKTLLNGSHAERSVIYVHGESGSKEMPKFTLNSTDTKGSGEMHFVVDYDRTMGYLNRLSTALHIKGITAEALQQSYQKHELTTARKLASGYQVVDVYITDRNNFEVVFDETQKIPSL